MDCTSTLLKKIFPNSNVAKKFSSGRTKTEKVVTSVLAQYSIDTVLKSFEEIRIAYFGIATDGSNHNELKLSPISIQYFDWRKGGLQSKLIEFTNYANEIADTIATYVKDCIHHCAKRMTIGIENNINKIYQYFSIYTVRTEQLKEYCEFANCEYKRFLSHSKTRWLSLFPGISRLLEMFQSLKSYFLS